MLKTDIVYFGENVTSACDGLCEKAWGINQRPQEQCSELEDDTVWLADGELGEAPMDPGTYEGGHGKPFHPDRHNKWCVRECERCKIFEKGQEIKIKDFSVRIYNMPQRHGAVSA